MKRRDILAISAGLAVPQLARAQERYPNRPITLVLGLAAGGSADATMRFVAHAATEELGVQVLVENRTGGAQTIAVTRVARSRPDGYTLMYAGNTPLCIVPHLQAVPYNVETDFTFIAQYSLVPHPAYVLSSSPFRTWRQLVDHARANQDSLKWAAATPLSGPHIATAAALQKEGVRSIFVPYQGGSEAVTALLGGHVDMVVSSDYPPLLETGSVRLLAEIGPERLAVMSEVPCYGELDYPLSMQISFGVGGPANLPPEVNETWIRVMRKIDAMPEWRALLARFQMVPALVVGDDYRTRMLGIYRRFGEVLPQIPVQR